MSSEGIQLTSAKCPNCGANIQVNPDNENYVCEYCQSNVMVKDAIQKLRVEVKVAGIQDEGDKEKIIKRLYEGKDYVTAKERVQELLQINPTNEVALQYLLKIDMHTIEEWREKMKQKEPSTPYDRYYLGLKKTTEYQRIQNMKRSPQLDKVWKEYNEKYDSYYNTFFNIWNKNRKEATSPKSTFKYIGKWLLIAIAGAGIMLFIILIKFL